LLIRLLYYLPMKMWATEWFKMYKLIQLLTEYNDNKEWERIWFITTVNIDWVPTPYELGKSDLLRWEDKIISKKYWFIKWLVENDKIDTDAYKTVYSWDLDKWKTLTREIWWDDFYQVTEHWVYESLLMLLSIQESPIEFLCFILKTDE
jgi:hypothetical protein